MRIRDSPEEVYGERWPGMQEEGGQFVETVEDKAVPPGNDGRKHGAHAENIVGLEPGQVVREPVGLDHHRKVDKVANVQHEPLVLVPGYYRKIYFLLSLSTFHLLIYYLLITETFVY